MKRIQWIDIAKGIAILAVVVGHVSIIPWEPYRKIIFSFHMPLFFIAAGYTSKTDLSWKAVKKLAIRLLVPYVFACILVGIVNLLQGSNFPTEVMRMLWGSGVPAQYGPGVPVTGAESIPTVGALWFLPCMFFSKVLFSIFLFVSNSLKEWIKAGIILIICLCGYVIGQYYKLPLCVDVALFNSIFLYAGYLFKKYDGISKKNITIGVICFVIWYIALKCNALELSARLYREFPLCIFTTLGAIGFCYLIFYVSEETLSKIKGIHHFLTWCGKNSLELLLIHHFDGIIWNYFWFTGWLPDLSGLSLLKQGCIISICKIVLYLILCAVYIFCKKRWKNFALKTTSL